MCWDIYGSLSTLVRAERELFTRLAPSMAPVVMLLSCHTGRHDLNSTGTGARGFARYRQESEDGPVSAECAQRLAEALEALLYDPDSITL